MLSAAQADEDAAGFTARVEARRISALHTLSSSQRARLGQVFTPQRAAALMADLPRLPDAGRFRVLDPGAGAGALAAAVAARAFRESPALELEVVAVEIDPDVASYLRATLTDLTQSANAAGITVATELVSGDYIELSTSLLTRPAALGGLFDLVIMNPPYRKLGLDSMQRQALRHQGVECPNLYAAFLALGVAALAPGGQLVAITPRSFANGSYFAQFRRFLLDRLSLDRLHVFESRSMVFADAGVLQENIAFSGTRQRVNGKVILSVSRSHLDNPVERVLSHSEVVRPGDEQHFIRILAEEGDTVATETMAALPATLPELDVQVSTGKVVDFRARDNLRRLPEPGAAPLIYPGNVQNGIIDWPREIRKHQAFSVRSEAEQRKFLFPAGFYVVVKRFSAKEERRRVVSAVWDPGQLPSPVAFENHLNIFHSHGAGLDRDLAVGLSYWLNSSIVDKFIRTFSGHTQVNATDLRALRFPPLSALRALGQGQELLLPKQEEIDQLVGRRVAGAVPARGLDLTAGPGAAASDTALTWPGRPELLG